jgi:membrane protein DedA with SNARE-associated domain
VTHLVDQLSGVAPALAYVIIGGLVLAEAALFVGFVLPGETAVLVGGVLASAHRLSLTTLLVVVVVAAIVGDTIGYEVGRHAGPRLLASRPLRRHSGRLDGARDTLRRRGGLAVLLGRFTAFLRAVMPALAGLSGMPYRRFLAWNAVGGVVWGVGVTLLGYAAGASYRTVETRLGRGSAALLVLIALVLLALHLRRRRRHRADAEAAAHEAPEATARRSR